MKRTLFLTLIFALILVLSLSGCAASPTQASPTLAAEVSEPPAVDPNSTAYAPPETGEQIVPNMTPDYPAPESQPAAPALSLPGDLTPAEGLSSIRGKLVSQDGSPYIIDLYLATFLKGNDESAPELLTFSENTSPRAIQDSNTGEFVFIGIEPGKYGLGISSPGGSFIIPDESGNFLSFETTSGEILDLGEIVVP